MWRFTCCTSPKGQPGAENLLYLGGFLPSKQFFPLMAQHAGKPG